MTTTTNQEIHAQITAMIANTIDIAPASLAPHDSLVDKFGMESLDVLDISFRLNKTYGLKLFRGDLLRKAAEVLGDQPMLEDGKLTEAAVALLRSRMPEHRDSPLLVAGAPRNVVIRLYCVESWVRQVLELREAGEQSGEAFLDAWLVRYREERLKVA